MLIPILVAFTLSGYSSISQHISEVALLDHPIASVQRAGALITGISVSLFGVGVVLAYGPRFAFTAVAAILFGASMVSNGVVVMGSPLHGLYGLGLFMSLVPAFFAAEAQRLVAGGVVRWSMACALFNLGYLWLLFSGLDPHDYRGVTQRVATVLIFGWYSVAAYALVRVREPSNKAGAS